MLLLVTYPSSQSYLIDLVQSWTNICKLFHALACPFTTSETELDYFYQKGNVLDTSLVTEQLKT